MAPRTIKTGSNPIAHGATPTKASAFESEEAGVSVWYSAAEIMALFDGNPTATGGDVAINGVSDEFMRKDACPPIQKCSTILFGLCKPDGATITVVGGVISAVTQATPVTTQTGTTYTLVLGDANTFINFDNAGAITLTVPTNASVAFPIGTTINISQVGAGVITVTAAGGVTLQSAGGLVASNGQYSVLAITKVATNVWRVYGNLA